MRLGVLDLIRPDDRVEHLLEPGDAQPALGAALHLARDEAERLAAGLEIAHRLHHAVVGAH